LPAEKSNGTVPPAPAAPASATEELPVVARFSARARALLEARGLDPSLFEGKGLIRESDIVRFLAGSGSSPAGHAASNSGSGRIPAVEPAAGVPVRREALSRLKVMEAKLLAAGNSNALASSVTVACPTRGLRRLVGNDPALRGNATALIVLETARLLRQFPMFNGYCHEEQVCYYEKVNVGFAVDAGQGLKVPVVHDTDTKPAAAIADEMHELIGRYLENRLPVAALTGGTFTLTDLSGEGASSFVPLISQGQSAILGVGAERFVPPSEEGEFNLILTFDHRLAEGRTAARFLNALKERLRAHEAALVPAVRSALGTSDAAGNKLFCGNCLRTAAQMKLLNGYLVRSAFPAGYLCNFCLGGF
jgi:pyruvate/2-oxoglutarate dehydrogenase complex dihydrolipoamide acyltransferase (E2) component